MLISCTIPTFNILTPELDENIHPQGVALAYVAAEPIIQGSMLSILVKASRHTYTSKPKEEPAFDSFGIRSATDAFLCLLPITGV